MKSQFAVALAPLFLLACQTQPAANTNTNTQVQEEPIDLEEVCESKRAVCSTWLKECKTNCKIADDEIRETCTETCEDSLEDCEAECKSAKDPVAFKVTDWEDKPKALSEDCGGVDQEPCDEDSDEFDECQPTLLKTSLVWGEDKELCVTPCEELYSDNVVGTSVNDDCDSGHLCGPIDSKGKKLGCVSGVCDPANSTHESCTYPNDNCAGAANKDSSASICAPSCLPYAPAEYSCPANQYCYGVAFGDTAAEQGFACAGKQAQPNGALKTEGQPCGIFTTSQSQEPEDIFRGLKEDCSNGLVCDMRTQGGASVCRTECGKITNGALTADQTKCGVGKTCTAPVNQGGYYSCL